MLTSRITLLELRIVTCRILFVAAAGWLSFSCVPLWASEPELRVIKPEKRTLTGEAFGHASFVESYERTSIYARVPGYIEKWKVDIGDTVKKGDVLATLLAPELHEEWEMKKAQINVAEGRVELAKKALKLKQAEVKTAEARIAAAKTMLKTNSPSRDASEAAVVVAEAELLEKKATVAQAEAAVNVAIAERKVAASEARKWEALVSYLTLTAPYDGQIVARNADTHDFVSPPLGEATDRLQTVRSRRVTEPICIIERTDIVRVFVSIPEDAELSVEAGTKATVRIAAYRDKPISAVVTRTFLALDGKDFRLRAEIHLLNPKGEILPGMYAYGKVYIKRSRDVWTLPLHALDESNNKLIYWEYKNGRAVARQVQTGSLDSEGKWVEVMKRWSPGSRGESLWMPIDGSEKVIVGDLSTLVDGKPVKVSKPSQSP